MLKISNLVRMLNRQLGTAEEKINQLKYWPVEIIHSVTKTWIYGKENKDKKV